jgi:hypothetical protein
MEIDRNNNCDRCGQDDCDGSVTLAPDPFSSEIYDDHTPVWMCKGERQIRRDDI